MSDSGGLGGTSQRLPGWDEGDDVKTVFMTYAAPELAALRTVAGGGEG